VKKKEIYITSDQYVKGTRGVCVDTKQNPLHKLTGDLSTQVWSLLYEEDYYTQGGPDEDALYDCVGAALLLALRDPVKRAELRAVLRNLP
jgi:hypothetical protein